MKSEQFKLSKEQAEAVAYSAKHSRDRAAELNQRALLQTDQGGLINVIKGGVLRRKAKQINGSAAKYEARLEGELEGYERLKSSDLARKLYDDAIEKAESLGKDDLVMELVTDSQRDALDLYEHSRDKGRSLTALLVEKIGWVMAQDSKSAKASVGAGGRGMIHDYNPVLGIGPIQPGLQDETSKSVMGRVYEACEVLGLGFNQERFDKQSARNASRLGNRLKLIGGGMFGPEESLTYAQIVYHAAREHGRPEGELTYEYDSISFEIEKNPSYILL